MRYASCVVFVILSLSGLSRLSAQSIDWEKSHGSNVGGYAVQRLDDGGFIAVGSGGQWPETVGYIVRTDADGAKVWEKTIGTGNPGVWISGVKKTADGGLAVVGQRNNQPWLWKYDLQGNEKWSKQLMGPDSYGDARAVVTVPDGIVVTGMNSVAGKYNLFAQKMSFAGDSIWSFQNTHKGSSGLGIRQALDGDFLIVGSTTVDQAGKTYFLKLSPTGTVVWEKSYSITPGTYGDEGRDISIATDGYLIVGARSTSTTTSRMDVIKTNLDGLMTWRKQYGSAEYSGANAVRPVQGGYIFVGYSGTSVDLKATAIRIDAQGVEKLALEFPGQSYLHYIDQAVPPNKFIVVGGGSPSKLYLARMEMNIDLPGSDEFTYIYSYNNQPLYAFKNSKGWVGEAPGWIKLKGTLDTVRVNEMLRFAALKFRLDTTRSSPTGTIGFQMEGYLLGAGHLSTKWDVIGYTESNGWIDKDGMHFNTPFRDPGNKGFAGTRHAIDRISIESYPNTPSISLFGDMLIPGMRSCQDKNVEKLNFSNFKITNNTASGFGMSMQTEPGVCYSPSINYDPAKDSLALFGSIYSEIYWEGVQGRSYVKNGEISELTLVPSSKNIPSLGSFAHIRDLKGKYMPWYLTLFGQKFYLGWAAFFSGTVNSILEPNLYEISLPEAAIIAPGEIHASAADYRMYKVGSNWNVQGSGPVKIKWTSYASMDGKLGDGTVNIGAKDNGEFIFKGNGSMATFAQQGSGTYTNGRATGALSIQTTNPAHLSTLQSVLYMLYGTGSPQAKATFNQYKGIATAIAKPGLDLSVEFDLSKSVSDAAFAKWPDMATLSGLLTQVMLVNGTKSKGHEKAAVNEFDVPANARGFYIGVKGIDGPATTTLQSPSGTLIEQTVQDSSVIRMNGEGNTYFWVAVRPEAGKWLINTTQGRDSIEILVFKELPAFELSTTQQNNNLTVSWTNPSSDSIDLFIDEQQGGFNGVYIGSVAGETGSAQIALPSGLTECSYYLYAQRRYYAVVQSDYSETAIDNSNGKLAGPNTWAASYNATEKTATLTWQPSPDTTVAGYIIRLRGNGIDSVLATQFADANSLTFPVEDPNGYFVAIMAYDTNGNRGCWSSFLPLGTSNVEQDFVQVKTLDAVVLPNPSRGRASLYLRAEESADVSIAIYDAAGRSISSSTAFYTMGEHDIDLRTDALPSGSYVLIVRSGDKTQTRNFVITR